ncbi:MAG: hypothetical protein RL756_694 [Pseudomonadota bacterium]|jgi:hypothetical protein
MDKFLHALVGATIAATPITPQQALGLVVLAAVGKELHDRRRGGDASGLDALATIAGAGPVLTLRWDW